MRIALIGSRSLSLSVDKILKEIDFINASEIVSGGATGIDSLSPFVANRLCVPCIEILPDYKKFGRIAPIIRNKEIVDRSDIVFAFWDGKSKGTIHAVNYARKKDIPVHLFNYSDYKKEQLSLF